MKRVARARKLLSAAREGRAVPFGAHVRKLWGQNWFLPLLAAVYAVILLAFGKLRPEHVAFGVICAVLGYWGPRAKQFFIDVAPYVTVAIGYDLVRYVRPWFVTPERVLGCNLRSVEVAWFGIAPNTTLQDFFSVHHAAGFDLLFAVPYTIFVYLVIVYAAYLYFRDRPRMRHYLLAFAIGNYISFACWLLFPAAPPWYLHTHGCAIDTAAVPSAAGLSRVDALLGINYYATFYSRASSVFGALPSMHCAYPLIGLLTAWRKATWLTRPAHVAYVLIMASAAIYLDHHWVIDAIAGWCTAIISVWAAGAWLARRGAVQSSVIAAEPALGEQP